MSLAHRIASLFQASLRQSVHMKINQYSPSFKNNGEGRGLNNFLALKKEGACKRGVGGGGGVLSGRGFSVREDIKIRN